MTYYFSTLSKEELSELARKGHDSKRSPALRKAWRDKLKIKDLYYNDVMTTKEIAEHYGIGRRQVYRIIAS